MPGDDEMTAAEIYAECDKRIKAAIDALEAKMQSAIDAVAAKIPEEKKPLRILRQR